jgi:rubrerythrin
MPDFGNAFSGLKCDRMLTHAELVRAIRFMISAEYEAIQLYMQLAESTDNTLAQQVLVEIADEERVHAGEFLRLLRELEPEEETFYRQGAQEVEEEFLGAAPAPDQSPGASAPATVAGVGIGIGSLKK